MKSSKTLTIDEKTPLMLIAGPMFIELFLNILLNNVDTLFRYTETRYCALVDFILDIWYSAYTD